MKKALITATIVAVVGFVATTVVTKAVGTSDLADKLSVNAEGKELDTVSQVETAEEKTEDMTTEVVEEAKKETTKKVVEKKVVAAPAATPRAERRVENTQPAPVATETTTSEETHTVSSMSGNTYTMSITEAPAEVTSAETTSLNEVESIEGSAEACAILQELGMTCE